MRTEKIGLWEFLFQRKMPGIEDGRCECRQSNQTVKHILLECRLLARQRRNLWIDEEKRVHKEGGGSLDIERILTDCSCQKAAMLIRKTGLTGRSMAPHGGKLIKYVPSNRKKTSSRFFNLGGLGQMSPIG